MRITSKNPVREAINNVATYFPNKGEMIRAIEAALRVHGVEAIFPALPGDSGRAECALQPTEKGCVICDDCGEKIDRAYYDNVLVLSWYRMDSGRIELTSYIS